MNSADFRIVFMGSPEFAVPSLRATAGRYQIAAVVTQPDKPAGRGKQLAACPVKQAALDLGLTVLQPEKMRDIWPQLQALAPDLILVAAFGKLLRPEVLALPRLGCVNVHASLLPRHRGAAPINAAVLAGDRQAGVTLMQMEAGLDTGPTLAARALDVLPGETASALTARLAELGAALVSDELPRYIAGTLTPAPQDETLATYAPQLKKEDGRLHWTDTAEALERRVRAMSDWPGAFFDYQGQPFKVLRAHVRPDRLAAPGRVIKVNGQPAVGTTEGVLVLDEIQPPGRRPMPAASYLNGNPAFVGTQLG